MREIKVNFSFPYDPYNEMSKIKRNTVELMMDKLDVLLLLQCGHFTNDFLFQEDSKYFKEGIMVDETIFGSYRVVKSKWYMSLNEIDIELEYI